MSAIGDQLIQQIKTGQNVKYISVLLKNDRMNSRLIRNAIPVAALHGSVPILELLLDRLPFSSKLLTSTLYIAVSNDKIEAVKFLIQKGAQDLELVFERACQNHAIKSIEYMIHNCGCHYWAAGLIGSCQGMHHDLVEKFVKLGATGFQTPLNILSQKEQSFELFKWLYKKIPKPDEINLQACFHIAVASHNSKLVEFICNVVKPSKQTQFIQALYLLADIEPMFANLTREEMQTYMYNDAKILSILLNLKPQLYSVSIFFQLPKHERLLGHVLWWQPTRETLQHIHNITPLFTKHDHLYKQMKQVLEGVLISVLADLCLQYYCPMI